MYAERIDIARKIVAVLFGVSGIGLVTCANLRYPVACLILGAVALLSLLATFGLFVEYLVRSWIETRRTRIEAFQISLSGLLIVIAVVALILAVFRLLGVCTIAILVAVIIILAIGTESVRLKHWESKQR